MSGQLKISDDRNKGKSGNEGFANVFLRYAIATLGMFLSAAGIAMTIIANIGTAPLSCPAYVLNLKWPALSVGTFNFMVNCTYIFVQVVLLRKAFKPKYLLQIVASAIFGYMIDLSMDIFSWLHPHTLASRYGLTLFSCAVSALGVSLEVAADAWMLSAEMTAFALSEVSKKSFSSMKIAMDCTMVVLSAAACFLFFGNVLGKGDIYVLGAGTVICAVLIGLCMKLTDPVAEKIVGLLRH